MLSTCVDAADTEEDSWTSADGEGEGDCEGNSDNGSSSSTVSVQHFQKKHFPPKAREIIPGCTVPVEVKIVCFITNKFY